MNPAMAVIPAEACILLKLLLKNPGLRRYDAILPKSFEKG